MEDVNAWRIRRQIFYTVLLFLLAAIPIGIAVYLIIPRASCTDGRMNQDELGIDCGGVCKKVCTQEVANLVPLWQRAFLVRPGEYDLAALVRNPNAEFGALHFSYTFSVYGAGNQLLTKKEGKSFMNPNDEFIIFEPRITLSQDPEKVFFEVKDVEWRRVPNYKKPELRVDNEMFTEKPLPRLSARLVNPLPKDFSFVEAIAEIRGDEDTVVAVSRSVVESLPHNSTQAIFFQWPQALPEAPSICARPIEAALLFDLSGSMDDDNANPPQPLTDAKNAALVFFDELGKKDKVGFISFATMAANPPEATLATSQSQVKTIIENLSIAPAEQRGLTNIGDAFKTGASLFSPVMQTGISAPRQVMVLLTDGLATGPTDKDPDEYATEEAKKAKDAGIQLYVIGLGKKVNQTLLRDTIASTPDTYFFSATSKELGDAYRKIAQDVCPEKVYLTRILERTKNEMEDSQ